MVELGYASRAVAFQGNSTKGTSQDVRDSFLHRRETTTLFVHYNHHHHHPPPTTARLAPDAQDDDSLRPCLCHQAKRCRRTRRICSRGLLPLARPITAPELKQVSRLRPFARASVWLSLVSLVSSGQSQPSTLSSERRSFVSTPSRLPSPSSNRPWRSARAASVEPMPHRLQLRSLARSRPALRSMR